MQEQEKEKIKLSDVQETLLLPLWARARETEKQHPVLHDDYAKYLIDRIEYDFSGLESNPELANNQQIQWAIRAWNFDNRIKEFLSENSKVLIINIGAGLDTASKRIQSENACWVNIELPGAANLRQKLIPDSETETTIPRSVFDFSWINAIVPQTKDRSILIMAAGVLFYFSSAEVVSLFRKLAAEYPGAHFIFDTITSGWIRWLTNRMIMRKSGMDPTVRLTWHLKKASQLRNYIPTLRVIEERSMFSSVPGTENWSRKMRRDLKIGNLLRVYNMIHVQF